MEGMEPAIRPSLGRARGRMLLRMDPQDREQPSRPGNLQAHSSSGTGTLQGSMQDPTQVDPVSFQFAGLEVSARTRGNFLARGSAIGDSVGLGTPRRHQLAIQPRNIAVNTGASRREEIPNVNTIPSSAAVVFKRKLNTRPKHITCKKGNTGREIVLQSNHFRLCASEGWAVYQYHIEFFPPKELESVRKGLLKGHRINLGAFIYDGKNLYSSKIYPSNPLVLVSTRESDGAQVSIRLMLEKKLDHTDAMNVQLFNSLMRKCLSGLKLQLVGLNYFDPSSKRTLTANRMTDWDLWPGYMVSICQYEQDVMLCVELTHKVMRTDTVLDMINHMTRGPQTDQTNSRLRSAVQGLVVLTDYNNRTYFITDVDFNLTPQSLFTLTTGRVLSYSQYYKEKYNTVIHNSQQPLLISKCRSRGDLKQVEQVYLVPELCRITGLHDDTKNMFMMRAFAGLTNFEPGKHITKLTSFCQRILDETPAREVLRDWNMSLTTELVQFQGRVLPQEKILLGEARGKKLNNKPLVEFDWNPDFRFLPMLDCVVLHNWVALVPREMRHDCAGFVSMLINVGLEMNMQIGNPRIIEMSDDNPSTYTSHLEQVLSSEIPQLVMCFVTSNQEDRYRAIKKTCYVDYAAPSQVITRKALENHWNYPIARRVAIQVNCKLGGSPWSVDIPLRGLMVVGIEVCVDAFRKGVSHCALLASLNGSFSRYFSGVSSFLSREELSKQICDLLSKANEKFCQHNGGKLPAYIVIYRDGVGNKQIPFIHEYEVPLIKECLAKLYGGKPLRLGFVLVSKHSHTRIFSRNGHNPPVGMVVDDCITRPERYDFFILSSPTQRLTAFPTMYNVISDNTGLDPDKMQRLTYKLTHLYYNINNIKGTVRIPAPCRYAQRLVQLVATHLHRSPHPDLCELLYFL